MLRDREFYSTLRGWSPAALAKEEEPPKWVLYHELAFTTKEYMRNVCLMEGAWLTEIAPHPALLPERRHRGSEEPVLLGSEEVMPHQRAVGKASA